MGALIVYVAFMAFAVGFLVGATLMKNRINQEPYSFLDSRKWRVREVGSTFRDQSSERRGYWL